MIPSDEQKQLERFVREKQPALLRNLSGEKKQQLFDLLRGIAPSEQSQVVYTQSQITSSPVPPADLLMGYSNAFENGAERLFALVERQGAHRQEIESTIVLEQSRRSRTGQVFAFILALVFGGIGLYLGIIGQVWLAGGIFTTTIGGLVATFVIGQRSQKRNLDKKAPK